LIVGMSGGGGLALPSVTRVAAGVLVTLALAFGGIMVMKRILLKTDGRWSPHGFRILGKAILGPSLRAHLIEVEAARVLVVEGRTGIGLTVLPTTPKAHKQDLEAGK
jgi:flagellar biogenesis protein FliO